MQENCEDDDKLKTGIDGLDELFEGGIRRRNTTIIEGAPGTGKTTLALQYVIEGALRFNEPGIIVLFEVDPDKLIRDAKGFGWDLEALEEKGLLKIIFTTPAIVLDEIHSPDNIWVQAVNEIGAKRLVIDSLTPIQHQAELSSKKPFRFSLHTLLEVISDMGVTAFITREARDGTRSQEVEIDDISYLADCVIEVRHELHNRNIHRYIEIIKSRGTDFVLGQHTLKIVGKQGIIVYRRAQSRPKDFDRATYQSRFMNSGIKGLDKIIGGGLYESSVTMISGISGTGKTIMALEFIAQGAIEDQKGLYISLEESPEQLKREAFAIGHSEDIFKDRVTFIYDPPIELELDIHFDKIARIIENHNIKRVVIDSIASYHSSNPAETKEFLFALTSYLKNKGVCAILTYESPELIGISQISSQPKASSLVDNIILLNYVEISTHLRRAVTVPKVRGCRNDRRTHEFQITSKGVVIFDVCEDDHSVDQQPFDNYHGLLGRAPTRYSTAETNASADHIVHEEPSTASSDES